MQNMVDSVEINSPPGWSRLSAKMLDRAMSTHR